MVLNMEYCVAQAIGALLSAVSAPLYLLECFIIVRHWRKGFNNSFYRIFLITAFMNLVLNFVFYSLPVSRFMQLGWFASFFMALPNWVARLFNFLSYFVVYIENFLTLAVIAHRLSAILWPMDFEPGWRYGLPIFVAVSIAASIGLSAPNFAQDVRFIVPNVTFHRILLGYKFYAGMKFYNAYELLCYVTVVFFLVSTALNVAIIVAYKRHKSKRGKGRDKDQQQKDALQYRLMVYTVAMFVAQTVHSFFWILAYFYTLFYTKTGGIFNAIYNAILPHYVWINDIRCLVFPSWFLFWASSEISGRVKALFSGIGTKMAKAVDKLPLKLLWPKKKRAVRNQPLFMVRKTTLLKERRRTYPTVSKSLPTVSN